MGNNLPGRACLYAWCTVQITGHTWHEGVLDTWIGSDPHMHDMPRTVQLVMFAPEPPGSLSAQPRLALSITGPDLRRPDRVSVTLPGKDWQRLKDRLGKPI